MKIFRDISTFVLLAGLTSFPAIAAPERMPMLIDKLSMDLWRGQRNALPKEFLEEQGIFREDITKYLHGRFRISGERMFVIQPDHGVKLTPAPFAMLGPGKLDEIHSWPAFSTRPHARLAQDASASCSNRTFITVGVTGRDNKTYTAIALHAIPDSSDELLGYFELEPLSANPMQGL